MIKFEYNSRFIIYAMRYAAAVGGSFAPMQVREEVKKLLPYLTPKTIEKIKKEIKNDIKYNNNVNWTWLLEDIAEEKEGRNKCRILEVE